jgi:hypothetical protein
MDACARLVLDAPVAQLDRASAFEAAGRGFEPLRARQTTPCSGSTPSSHGFVWASQFPST